MVVATSADEASGWLTCRRNGNDHYTTPCVSNNLSSEINGWFGEGKGVMGRAPQSSPAAAVVATVVVSV